MEFLLLPLSGCQAEKVGFSYKSKQMQTVVIHEQRLMCEEFLSGVYSAPIKSHFINSIRFLDRRKLINFFPPLSRPRWQYGTVLGEAHTGSCWNRVLWFLRNGKRIYVV